MANIRASTASGKKPAAVKKAPKKTAAPSTAKTTAAPTPRKTVTRKATVPRAQVDTQSKVTAEERQKMIAEAAYLRAESRGFAGGNPADDWLAAEAEIDQILSRT